MVQRLKLPARSYVVIGGGVLEALGIRDTMDVDLVVNQKRTTNLKQRLERIRPGRRQAVAVLQRATKSCYPG